MTQTFNWLLGSVSNMYFIFSNLVRPAAPAWHMKRSVESSGAKIGQRVRILAFVIFNPFLNNLYFLTANTA